MIEYLSHAHTPEELKNEVVADIYRRIASLDAYAKNVAKGAAERARIARASEELASMLAYWQSLKIVRSKSKRELEREAKQRDASAKDISGSGSLPRMSTAPASSIPMFVRSKDIEQ